MYTLGEEILTNLAIIRQINCPNSPKFLVAKIKFLDHSPKLIFAKFNVLYLESPFFLRNTFFVLFQVIFSEKNEKWAKALKAS